MSPTASDGRPQSPTSQALTFVHLDVDGAPPDVVLGGLFVDDALVLWAATGLLAGKVDQSAAGGDDGALVPDRVLVQEGRGRVALDMDPVHVESSLGEVLDITADDCILIKTWSVTAQI